MRDIVTYCRSSALGLWRLVVPYTEDQPKDQNQRPKTSGTFAYSWCLNIRLLLELPDGAHIEKGCLQMPINLLVALSIALLNLTEQVETSFDDLGKLMVVGVSAAVVIAVAFTLVRFRLRDKNPPTSNFISISAPQKREKEIGN
jgi:hypothetical protein